jgi:hypothetical protein
MHSLLEVSIADLAEWEVSLDRALFTAVETNFEELPSKIPHRYVNIVGEHYESIHITINKDGQVQQFPVKNAGDIAKFLRRKLTSEILNKYPDLRNLVDDIELDDAKLSLNRLVEAERWIGDLIIQGEITREGGEVLVYLAGIFDSIIRR